MLRQHIENEPTRMSSWHSMHGEKMHKFRQSRNELTNMLDQYTENDLTGIMSQHRRNVIQLNAARDKSAVYIYRTFKAFILMIYTEHLRYL